MFAVIKGFVGLFEKFVCKIRKHFGSNANYYEIC